MMRSFVAQDGGEVEAREAMVRVPIVDRRSSQAPEVPRVVEPGVGMNEDAVGGTSSQPPEPPAPPAPAEPGPADGRTAALAAERDEWRDRCLRATAELENVRRVAQQRVEAEVFRRERERMERWLELGDALDRARGAAAGAPPEWSRGLEEVARLFEDLMRRAGAVRFEPGETFDPQWHEAVSAVPQSEKPDGAIVAVVRAGWKLGERLLRPAGVAVARRSSS
ncbi:MAG: nucleotide exchange factor GrpE [Deltaproteobacteria bacterium]|nr:nucleotide exchange factor GrpE [Deltaproteobacteria bacterium]